MYYRGNKNSMKYNKKDECHCNSTKSFRVYSKAAYSYRETLVIVFDDLKVLLYNNTSWSVTTSQHYSSLDRSKLYAGLGFKELIINFNGSSNFLIDKTKKKIKDLGIESFKNCTNSPGLKEFLSMIFSTKEVTKLLDGIDKEHLENLEAYKKRAAKYRLYRNIERLNYSSEKNLKKAIEKYIKLSGLNTGYSGFRFKNINFQTLLIFEDFFTSGLGSWFSYNFYDQERKILAAFKNKKDTIKLFNDISENNKEESDLKYAGN
jgi:hypothetical protein